MMGLEMSFKQAKRIFIFDPCFGGMTGHWENYCKRITQALINRGYEVCVFGQEKFLANIVAGMNFKPVFKTDPFSYTKNMNDLKRISNSFLNDLTDINAAEFQDGDIFIFHSIYANYFSAIINWTKSLVKNKQILCLFTFQFPPSETKKHVGPLKNIYYALRRLFYGERLSAKSLQWCENNQVRLYQEAIPDLKVLVKQSHLLMASTEVLSTNFSLMLGLKVHCLPMPGLALNVASTTVHEQDNVNESMPLKKLKIGYFGHGCIDKGAAYLEGIVTHVLSKHENLEFHIHVNPNEGARIYFDKLASMPDERMHLYHGHIEEATLMELINQVDIVILPYAARKYATCSSAVFMEALSFGKVMVIPSGTWMDMISSHYDVEAYRFNEFTLDSICKAIDAALIHHRPYSSRMKNAAKQFTITNNIETYLDRIFECVNELEYGNHG